MGDMIGAAAQRPAIPLDVNVEGEWHMHANGGMQRIGRLPGTIAHARHVLAGHAGGMQRQAIAVAGDDVTRLVQSLDLDLQALDRAVDIAHHAAAARLLAEHVPGLERMT